MNATTPVYFIKARTAVPDFTKGTVEFRTLEKKFTDDSPIEAREAAFRFRNDYLYGILLSLGIQEEEIRWNNEKHEIEGLSDREIRKIVNPFLATGTNQNQDHEPNYGDSTWQTPDDTDSWYEISHTGIWVLFQESEGSEELVVDKICRYSGELPTPPLSLNLMHEMNVYIDNGYDTKDYITNVTFFDDELYLEGGASKEASQIHFNFLKTPFDWTEYESFGWWENGQNQSTDSYPSSKEYRNVNVLPSIDFALSKGEHEQVEFKPGLINRVDSTRDIEFEIAKTLTAFLNSNGGYLFIGLRDDGSPVPDLRRGASQEYFRREFTRVKSKYLPQFIAHSIYGDFFSYIEREIFVVTVYPSEEYPVFLRKKEEDGRVSKEFYVRSDAASRHIYDIEELVKYCRSKWK